MEIDPLLLSFFFIFSGAAVISTFALYLRQPLLVSYIVLGAILGPYGLEMISDPTLLAEIAQFGIIFLLFLLGLDMQPDKLMVTLKKTVFVTAASSILFFFIGYSIGILFEQNQTESVVIGLATIFSSTIIGIKLLPTTVLHQKHMGELMVGILLLQDLIAIFVLIYLYSGEVSNLGALKIVLALPLLVAFAYVFTKYVLVRLIMRFEQFKEYIFLLAIGWCLGLAAASTWLGLSPEIGAFVAGVSLATSPIAQYIAINLKPLRDFFLILFFFSLGAQFNVGLLSQIIVPALLLSFAVLVSKPIVFRYLLRKFSEQNRLAWDAGLRLGQISEFSLLIAYVATRTNVIGEISSHIIQAAALMTFLISSYIIVFYCPTPIGLSDKLRRD